MTGDHLHLHLMAALRRYEHHCVRRWRISTPTQRGLSLVAQSYFAAEVHVRSGGRETLKVLAIRPGKESALDSLRHAAPSNAQGE